MRTRFSLGVSTLRPIVIGGIDTQMSLPAGSTLIFLGHLERIPNHNEDGGLNWLPSFQANSLKSLD